MKWLKDYICPANLIWILGTFIVLVPVFLTDHNPTPSIFAYFGTQSIWSIIEKILYDQKV